MNKFLLLLTSLYVTTFFSQITNSSWIRYENYVDTLSSNYFKGRGYVDNGHLKAAKFISNEFQRIGLDSITSSGYLQHFKTNVNTFPTEIKLKINDDSLIAGVDYLIEPGSVSCQGIFEVLEINLSNWKSFSLNKKNEDLCLLIDVSNVGNKDSLLIYNEIKKILNKKYPILSLQRRQEGTPVVEFTILKNGNVTNLTVSSSGFRLLDRDAQKIVLKSSPFPPIPDSILKKSIDLRIPINFNLQRQ